MTRTRWKYLQTEHYIKTPDIMQSGRGEDNTCLLRSSLAPTARLASCWLVGGASHWSANWPWLVVVVVVEGEKKKSLLEGSWQWLPCQDAARFVHGEEAKRRRQGNHQRCSGISSKLRRGRPWFRPDRRLVTRRLPGVLLSQRGDGF